MYASDRPINIWYIPWCCLAAVSGCAVLTSASPDRGIAHPQPVLGAGEGSTLLFESQRTTPDGPADDDIVVVRLLFDVERVLVPAEVMATERERLWKYVDELRTDPTTSALLARNGFRIGVAGPTGQNGMRSVLEELRARCERVRHTVQAGAPLTLDLGAVGEGQTVFTIGPDGSLKGKTFRAATKLLHVDYEVSIGEAPRTTLRITPEVFKEDAQPHWQMRDGAIQYQKRYLGMVYREFAVEVNTVPGEAIVIGATESEPESLTLGSMMFGESVGGRRWETLLCIEPVLFRTAGTGDVPK